MELVERIVQSEKADSFTHCVRIHYWPARGNTWELYYGIRANGDICLWMD